jgi:hypothetical protein
MSVGPCGGRAVVPVVWGVVVLVAEGSLEQETSIKARTGSTEPSMIALFISMYLVIENSFLSLH